ncbi:MAG TPA: uracil-DNA glycosylase family protein [Anaerolineales bacterium]|nr:uracil-DNA glycosylase family protein [Anaerolineales bacterium]
MTAEKLSALQITMDGCRLCLEAGHDIYPRAIYSGRLGARIMTVGQAPGITEKDAGRPFNAGSGTRLFQWLARAGIDEAWFRSTQYMTSVTKCFPGKAKSGAGDRVPSKAEQALCRAYLDEEIALVDPALIIPIGNLAIHIFYPDKPKLVDLIGTEKQVEGRWVVPLPHPSGASRWTQAAENRVLIEKAVKLIRAHHSLLFPKVK